MRTCETTEGCAWMGGPNGECWSTDPAQCEGLDQAMCMQNPACRWDNQKMTCGAG
jgi:hypothetical protein